MNPFPWRRRRRVLRSCDPAFEIEHRLERIRHSPTARKCEERQLPRKGRCKTWIDDLAKYGERP